MTLTAKIASKSARETASRSPWLGAWRVMPALFASASMRP
jgi:hypothetical protein